MAKLIERAEQRILASGKPMGTAPHPGCTWKDMMARGYAFVNASSNMAKLRDSSLADMRAFREAHP